MYTPKKNRLANNCKWCPHTSSNGSWLTKGCLGKQILERQRTWPLTGLVLLTFWLHIRLVLLTSTAGAPQLLTNWPIPPMSFEGSSFAFFRAPFWGSVKVFLGTNPVPDWRCSPSPSSRQIHGSHPFVWFPGVMLDCANFHCCLTQTNVDRWLVNPIEIDQDLWFPEYLLASWSLGAWELAKQMFYASRIPSRITFHPWIGHSICGQLAIHGCRFLSESQWRCHLSIMVSTTIQTTTKEKHVSQT